MADVETAWDFLWTTDALKRVDRRNLVPEAYRRENSAEHSWQFALAAWTFAEFANEPVNVDRVIRMALVHDIVEVDAGDVFVYDVEARKAKEEVERKAAERIFGGLGGELGQEMRELWDEFEEQTTPEAKYAKAIDRLLPLTCNFKTQGKAWIEHGVTREMALRINAPIEAGSRALWTKAKAIIDEAHANGWLG